MKKFKLCLRYFDEGESVTGGDATANEVSANPVESTNETDTTSRPSFKELINGDYKEEADKYIQGLMSKRFKANKDMEARLSEQDRILDVVASKYKTDKADLNALFEAVSNDDSYYEDQAMEEGLTVDQYKRIAQAEAKNRQYEAQMAEAQRQAEADKQVAMWQQQAEQVKANFPDFDLATELQNDLFQRQLQAGVDMESAYVSAHKAEILTGAMQYTANKVREATANDIAARGLRPRENASSNRASAIVKKDVSALTKADREELERRAMAGEIINL